MPRILLTLVLLSVFYGIPLRALEPSEPSEPSEPLEPSLAPAHPYLFVWAGDEKKLGNDFLAVLDADPASASYGRLVSSVETQQRTVRPHHTEYTMPASGRLFANDHDAGRTYILDVRDPLQPAITTFFDDMAGFSHPHSYVRLPNGNVLATFQHTHSASEGAGMPGVAAGKSGGLVEIDDRGMVVRAAGNADPAFSSALLMPYGLVVLPDIDRVVSTNSSMHMDDLLSGTTYQIWRLSDLKLLRTSHFGVGENRYAHLIPQEPRRAPDGSVLVQTLSCGIERISGIDTANPESKLVHTFPGNWCGVPTIVERFLVEAVPALHGFVVLDIADPAKPVEVSRLKVSAEFSPHWSAWDPATQRIAAPPNAPGDNRLYLLKLDTKTGALTVDTSFRDADGKPGVSFGERLWPHGWKGTASPHGAVFSR
jgi:hypothetical protein